MEKVPGTTPPESPVVVQTGNVKTTEFHFDTSPSCKQSSENTLSSGKDHACKTNSIPDRLKLPKALKYPERYTSPTDMMMSPVTKGLLARHKKGGACIPPSINQTKIQELRIQDVGLFQN